MKPYVHPRFYMAPEPVLRLGLWLQHFLKPREDLRMTAGQLWELAREHHCRISRRSLPAALDDLAEVSMIDLSRKGHTLKVSLRYEGGA